MGAASIVLMLVPAELVAGVFVDLRATPIVIAGLFGGVLPGLLSGALAMVYRSYVGGIGAFAGITSIAFAMLVGIAAFKLRGSRRLQPADILSVGLAASLSTMCATLVLPVEVRLLILESVTAPSAALIFASVFITGLALYAEQSRIEAMTSRRVYKAIVEALPDCLNMKDVDGRFLAANAATARLMDAVDAAELLGKTDDDFYPVEIAKVFRVDEVSVMNEGKSRTIEQKIVRSDGTRTWLSTLKAPYRDGDGQIVGLITHNRDITEKKELEIELDANRARLDAALTYMADGLVMFDQHGKILLCNEQYRAMFPLTADLRKSGSEYRSVLRAAVERGEAAVAPIEVETWVDRTFASAYQFGDREIRLSDGRWVQIRTRPFGDGASLAVLSDITASKLAEEKLVATNEKLSNLAKHDGLTGLFARRVFNEAISREVARSRRTGAPLALLLIDIDWFKLYNDHNGHQAGDRCLKAVAKAIQASATRATDCVCRYGGEELAVLLPDTGFDGAAKLAEVICKSVRKLNIRHQQSPKKIVTVSVGINVAAKQKPTVEQLVAGADTALYQAKAAGRDIARPAPAGVSPHSIGLAG